MIHFSRVIQGIANYVDNELVAKLNGSWKAWLLGSAAGLAASRANALFLQYKDSPIAAALGLVDGENVNVEAVFAELKRQAQKGTATVSLPIIGAVTFGPADVDALYRYIIA